MFNSSTIDVAIGLVLIYVILSLFCSAINEWIARFFALRATGLRRGINELLAGGAESGLAAAFHRHPLVDALKPRQPPVLRRLTERERELAKYPSYIASQTFALTVMDLTMKVDPPAAPGGVGAARLKATIGNTTEAVPAVLRSLLQDVENDADAVRHRLESWFDDAMQRVSGWYKRRMQVLLFVIAGVMAIALNADTLRISQRLMRDSVLRAALVQQATQLVQRDTLHGSGSSKRMGSDLDGLVSSGVPLGWDPTCFPMSRLAGARTPEGSCSVSVMNGLGIALTMIALSFGAPFWFDLLNRLVNLRQTGDPPITKTAAR